MKVKVRHPEYLKAHSDIYQDKPHKVNVYEIWQSPLFL